MGIKLVVFDIAGTTLKDNDEVSKTFQSALKSHGFDIALKLINPLMGYEKKLAIRKLLAICGATDQDITHELIDGIHKQFVDDMIRYYQFGEGVVSLPNVEDTFKELHAQGIIVGVNTGFSRAIADAVIARLGWLEHGLVDYVIGSDEVELGRPHPFMIEKLMENSQVSASDEVVKVGDTEVDVREGQNSGCRFVIGVTTGAFTREELEPFGPTHIIDDIAEVLTIINQ
ncbi:MAG: HAD family hydrolase [Pedobacter sp.]|nr:MAG: HAD family hydrolase [Pedobacter sp.]